MWLILYMFIATLLFAPLSVSGGANDWAEGGMDAADGATRDYYNRAAQLEWEHDLGDWRDANNIPQGGQAYATTTIEDTNEPRYVQWDVTSLVKEWIVKKYVNQGFFLDAISGSGPTNFRSREHADLSQRPKLVVNIGGQALVFDAIADTYLEPSTYRSMGDSEKLSLRTGGSNVLLRFDLSSIERGALVTSASLKLFTHEQYGSNPVEVSVFRCSQGESLAPVQPRLGIASNYIFDRGVEAHPDVIFATGFESADWRSEWSSANGTIEVMNDDPALRFAELTGNALRAKIPKGENSSMSVIYKFFDKQGQEPEEIYFRYYIRFADDWDQTVFGGKLPGISGTYGKAGWGGRKPDGTDGWSARGTYFLSIHGENPLAETTPIGTYCYYADQPGIYGDTWSWTKAYKGFLRKNKWYSIEQYLKMNTPGSHDGIIRAWVDGVPAFEKKDIMFRTVERLKIEQIWMNVYHGGTAESPYDQHVYFDNVVIARDYIGPMSGSVGKTAFPWELMLLRGKKR